MYIKFKCKEPCVVGEMFCPMHLVIGKMENLDISSEITVRDHEDVRLPMLPIMANIIVPIRSSKTNKRIREKMRIDEPLDNITYQEHLKFEKLCFEFRDFQDQLNANAELPFPEEKFLR